MHAQYDTLVGWQWCLICFIALEVVAAVGLLFAASQRLQSDDFRAVDDASGGIVSGLVRNTIILLLVGLALHVIVAVAHQRAWRKMTKRATPA